MAKYLSEGVGGQIIALINKGYSQQQVATKVGLLKVALQQTIKRLKNTQSFSSLPKPRRPQSTTPQHVQFKKNWKLDKLLFPNELMFDIHGNNRLVMYFLHVGIILKH